VKLKLFDRNFSSINQSINQCFIIELVRPLTKVLTKVDRTKLFNIQPFPVR